MLVSSVSTEAYDCIKAESCCAFFVVFCFNEISNLFFCHAFFNVGSSSFHNHVIDYRCLSHDLDFFFILNSTNTVYTVRSPYRFQFRAAFLKRDQETSRKCFVDTDYALGIDMFCQNPNLIIHITEPYFFKSCIRYIIQIVQEHGVLSVCTKQQSVQSFPRMYHDAR